MCFLVYNVDISSMRESKNIIYKNKKEKKTKFLIKNCYTKDKYFHQHKKFILNTEIINGVVSARSVLQRRVCVHLNSHWRD